MSGGGNNIRPDKRHGNRHMSGEIVPLYEVCPDIGPEMRQITVRHHQHLPNGVYDLVDAYCGDPECDCRVAYLFVIRDTQPTAVLASITFGWEPLEFYANWIGVNDEITRDLKGPALMPMAPQSELAPASLGLVIPRLREHGYVELLKRHYRQFKAALRRQR